eukprot:3594855-Ditylum_brightwellii.AAC.1
MADVDVNLFCTNLLLALAPFSTPTIFPSLHTYLTINGLTVTNKMQQLLRDYYTSSDIFEHV